MVGTRGAQPVQPVSYDLRRPETAQADALRLLDASRIAINQALTALWPHLDVFTTERTGPAWKQVDALLPSPDPHGSRRWRCEAEVVSRLLRAQAERRPAGKERIAVAPAITAIRALQRDLNGDLKRDPDDATSVWHLCQVRDVSVKPVSSTGTGAGLLLPHRVPMPARR